MKLSDPADGAHALSERAQKIHAVLPQTQCQRCGQPDCARYAQAIAQQGEAINLCPPGGVQGIARIAAALGNPALAHGLTLDPQSGSEGPMTVAVIDEAWCIGCTLCVKACPTDAIVGSNKRMHTVIADACTGCDLCVLACPVDCIAMEPVSGNKTGWEAWSQAQADEALRRYTFHQFLTERAQQENAARLQAQAEKKLENLQAYSQHTDPDVLDKKRAVIAAALAAARAKRAASQGTSGQS